MYGLFQRVHLPKQFPVAFLNTNRFSFCIKNPTPSTIPSKSLSAKDRQRILNANNYPQKNSRFKTSTYNNIAIGCLFFSLCFAGIPLYRSFCEHTGISGGTEKKAYEFKDTQCT